MKSNSKIVAWQPVLTDHQAHTFAALQQLSGRPIVALVTRLEDPTRKAQGWVDTQVKSIERRLLPPRKTWLEGWRRLREHRNDVHVFCSPFEQPSLIFSLVCAVWLGLEVYVISEPYSPGSDGYFFDSSRWASWVKAQLRPVIYRVYALLIRRAVKGVFAISELAAQQYMHAGVQKEKIFRFGYFVPTADNRVRSEPQPDSASLRLAFVGSLIRRKGLDLALAAVREVNRRGLAVTLDVFGPGDRTSFQLEGDTVRFCGLIPFGQAQAVMADYDAIVVPSRYDGWGVVVNESICAAVPVLCSSEVGSKVLVERFKSGLTFSSSSSSSLCDAIEWLADNGTALAAMKLATIAAAAAIQPLNAARYMYSVMQAEPSMKAQVPSPWYGSAP